MTNPQEDPKEDPIQRGLEELRIIGREIGGRLKDAGEDVKEAWKKLQPGLQKAEQLASKKGDELAGEVSHAATAVIDDLKGQLQRLRARLERQR